MIDGDGFRPNVGIVICNRDGQVLWAKRYGQHSWQFPQGGVDDGESPEQAMYRELYEEIGLKPEDVTILATSRNWLKYRLPKRLVRWDSSPVCIGQKQKWFLLQLDLAESPGSSSAVMVTRNLMIGVGSASGTRFVRSSPSSGKFTAG